MKMLLSTAILALSVTSAHAWQPRFDAQEFYSGEPDSQVVTRSETQPESLYLEGNYGDINRKSALHEGDAIGHASDPDGSLYQEAAYDV